jgi:hypothetical protein
VVGSDRLENGTGDGVAHPVAFDAFRGLVLEVSDGVPLEQHNPIQRELG